MDRKRIAATMVVLVAGCADDITVSTTSTGAGAGGSGGTGGALGATTTSATVNSSETASSSTGVVCDACEPKQCEPVACSDGSFHQCSMCVLPDVCSLKTSSPIHHCSQDCVSSDESACASVGAPSAWGASAECATIYRIENGIVVFRQGGSAGCEPQQVGGTNLWCCP